MLERLGAEYENEDFEFIDLSDVWDEAEFVLPKKIRCQVHNLALMGVIDFLSRSQIDFWSANPHGEFKSKYIIF